MLTPAAHSTWMQPARPRRLVDLGAISGIVACLAGPVLIYFYALKDLGTEGNDRLVYASDFQAVLDTGSTMIEFRSYEIFLGLFYKFLVLCGVTEFDTALLAGAQLHYALVLLGLYMMRQRFVEQDRWLIVFLTVAFLNFLWPSFAIRQAFSIVFLFLFHAANRRWMKASFATLAITSHYYALFILALYGLVYVVRNARNIAYPIALFFALLLGGLFFGDRIYGELNQTLYKFSASALQLSQSAILTAKVVYLLPLVVLARQRSPYPALRYDSDLNAYIICCLLTFSVFYVPFASLRIMAYFTTVVSGIVLFKSLRMLLGNHWRRWALGLGWAKLGLAVFGLVM